ncbi:MAG: hypothetical protein ABIB93_03175 [Chloroflexota bacterium]
MNYPQEVVVPAGDLKGGMMERFVSLAIGDEFHLRFGKDRIFYAGMPSEKVYSFVQKKKEFPYQGYAWNLFFPREQQKIRIDGINLIVENVSPDEIQLRV